MTSQFRCASCQTVSDCDGDPNESVLRCDCGAVTSFGVTMPRVSLVPDAQHRLYALRFEFGSKEGTAVSTVIIDNSILRRLVCDGASVL